MLPALSAAGFALPPLLVDFALKSTLVLGMATLIAAGLRRSSAAARHAVWGVALGGLLLLAAVRTLAPGWSVSVLPARISGRKPVGGRSRIWQNQRRKPRRPVTWSASVTWTPS